MALIEEASPICRGKNLSWETVLLFFNNMPREAMPKAMFNSYVEARINAWTQTHSQIARQLAFYYEDNGMCYPRFTEKTSLQNLFAYMQNWATKYFIPNPYAPSLKGNVPTCIYSFIIKSIKDGQTDFDEILDSIFQVKLSSHDKVNVYLSYFTNLLIDNNHKVSINSAVDSINTELHPDIVFANNPKKYFDYFTIGLKSDISAVINNSSIYRSYITALRTKPFLLLAGISGTGKSQKVQELAFMTCPDGEMRNEGGTTPGNYCLVEVKPNWHDSTELLGYYSALSGKYELTDFIRFAYKASQNKDVPFFLCLDEMNLAPVEQYFAEFLSVLETRKKVGDEILTQYLLSKDRFSNCELQKKVLVKDEGDIIEGDKQYKMEFLYSEKDAEIITYLKEKGLTLPDNLFVIGTVNMDDTTHQFSRKVIDRAFTIEMNGGKMSEMFSPESKMLLEYRDEPIPLEAFKAEFVRAYEVLDDARFAKYKDVISTRIPKLLGDSDGSAEADSINGILNETPFRVSYRVQNELVLYLSILIERANFPEPDQIEGLIGEATLAILLEKVLPRVQGEQKQLETQNGKSNVLKDLKTFVESHFKPEEETDANSLYNQVLRKLKEMDDKLANYYTNFF